MENGSDRMTSKWVQIPPDVFVDILLRLPWSSVRASKEVCKSWYSVITSQRFMKPHIERKYKLDFPRILIHDIPASTLSFVDVTSWEVIGQITIEPTGYYRLAGSCNGVICIHKYWEGPILFNPVSGKNIAIPPPPNDPNSMDTFFYYLGFDQSIEKLKVLCNNTVTGTSMIYTVGGTSWQPVQGTSYKMPCHHIVNSSGSLYWFSFVGDSECICSFDFKEEKFKCFDLEADQASQETREEEAHEMGLNENLWLPTLSKFYHELNDDGNTKNFVDIWTMNKGNGDQHLRKHKIELRHFQPDDIHVPPTTLFICGIVIAAHYSAPNALGFINLEEEASYCNLDLPWCCSVCLFEFGCGI
ncbi:F-box family protein [Rhynchospora pubera]|uniref:F-box family protein n=1 Tax=Rhynchospora pubera TaxID=906938 RepID=A0AAV8DUG4_9POAL|nr:F-box family protein [Rhynchospora pubera]